jgi:tetratricopeptide (TPR) repeat protein
LWLGKFKLYWDPDPGHGHLTSWVLPWLTRADERGLAEASRQLSLALRQLGDRDDVEASLRRNEEGGFADGVRRLREVLRWLDHHDGVEAVMRRAEDRGDPEAATELGRLLLSRYTPPSGSGTQDEAGAEAAFRRAVELDYTDYPWSYLARCLGQRGKRDEAELAWRRATERGEQPALDRPARLEQEERYRATQRKLARQARLEQLRRKYRDT